MTAGQRLAVRSLLIAFMPDIVLHGGCIGADTDFDDMAADFNIVTEVYPTVLKSDHLARWYLLRNTSSRIVVHLPLPPLVRNKILAQRCKVLIATPKEDYERIRSGTWATVRYAREAHKRIYLVMPDGSVKED